jgi:hypothetical protein
MPSSKWPKYIKTARIGNKGVRIVENIVHDQLEWIFREQEGQKDFGIDAHIEIVDGDATLGRILAVQIKCGISFFREKDETGYIFHGEQNTSTTF